MLLWWEFKNPTYICSWRPKVEES